MTIGCEVRRLVGAAFLVAAMTTGNVRAQQAIPSDSLWALARHATAQQCYDDGAYLYGRVAVAERWAPARSAACYKVAGCHARLGNTTLAMMALKDAQLSWTAAESMHHDPDLARLRTEPEFIEFLRKSASSRLISTCFGKRIPRQTGKTRRPVAGHFKKTTSTRAVLPFRSSTGWR
jgi:hypothetical protein